VLPQHLIVTNFNGLAGRNGIYSLLDFIYTIMLLIETVFGLLANFFVLLVIASDQKTVRR